MCWRSLVLCMAMTAVLGCSKSEVPSDGDSAVMQEEDHEHYHVHAADVSHEHSHDKQQHTAHEHEHTHDHEESADRTDNEVSEQQNAE